MLKNYLAKRARMKQGKVETEVFVKTQALHDLITTGVLKVDYENCVVTVNSAYWNLATLKRSPFVKNVAILVSGLSNKTTTYCTFNNSEGLPIAEYKNDTAYIFTE